MTITREQLRAVKLELRSTFEAWQAHPTEDNEDIWRAAQLRWTTVSQQFLNEAIEPLQ